jgi:nicotinamidase/pyrazinamidase
MRALLVVDVQNDFCPGGSLAVAEGDAVVELLTELAGAMRATGAPVIASRDWHPAATTHFAELGGRWPPHCVQGTGGAGFHPRLDLPAGTVVVSKGTGVAEDAYSAFEGKDASGRPLAALLREAGVDELVVGGLATDHCVRASVLDAARQGIAVAVVADACRAVDPRAGADALEEMKRAGARITTTAEVLRAVRNPAQPVV